MASQRALLPSLSEDGLPMEWDAYSDGELVASNVGFIGGAERGANTELAEYGYRARLVSSDAMAEVLSVPCGDVVVYDLVGRLLYVGERMPEGGRGHYVVNGRLRYLR